MTYTEALQIVNRHVLPAALELYGLEGYDAKALPAHEGGRNIVYSCGKENADARILRISYLPDRSRADFMAETEYIRYLRRQGGSVANVFASIHGNLLETLEHDRQIFFIVLFERAKGKMLVDNHYQYRAGAPITEYFYNCGKTLGKLHQLSKEYVPVYPRYNFLEKFNNAYINKVIPSNLPLLKENIRRLMLELSGLDQSVENYGMVHFDYNDGNYHIDFETGQITVFDFDNCCMGWYMIDLSSAWQSGEGWVRHESNAENRARLWNEYFETVLAGYRSETRLDEAMLEKLPFFIQADFIENITDAFEVLERNGNTEGFIDRVECMAEDSSVKIFLMELVDENGEFIGDINEFIKK